MKAGDSELKSCAPPKTKDDTTFHSTFLSHYLHSIFILQLMWWPVQFENYSKHWQHHVPFLVTTAKIFLVPCWHFLWTEHPIHEIFTLKNSKGSSWCQLGDVSGSVLSDHCFTQTMNMPCNSKSMSHWGLKIWCWSKTAEDEHWLIDRTANDCWIFIKAVHLERKF